MYLNWLLEALLMMIYPDLLGKGRTVGISPLPPRSDCE
jgi:hypothetical protein